jgi:hypothetical protein
MAFSRRAIDRLSRRSPLMSLLTGPAATVEVAQAEFDAIVVSLRQK